MADPSATMTEDAPKLAPAGELAAKNAADFPNESAEYRAARNAASNRRASSRAARCACRQRHRSRTSQVVSKLIAGFDMPQLC